MATNPTVEKLKVFGLRHGEKIAMGVVTGVFVLCAYLAATHESIQLTPADVEKSAKGAQANIRREQKYDAVVEKLEQAGVKVANFEKVVDGRQNTVFDAKKYTLVASLFSPEPGAGLIRDMPQFLAPEELYVYANRGAVKIFKFDENGYPVLKPEPKGAPKKKRRTVRRGGMMGGGGMIAGGAARKKTGKSAKQLAEEAKKAADEAAARALKGVAGGEAKEAVKDEPEELPSDNPNDYEQINTGFRMITVVGKFDHKRQRELYAKALKVDLASANPEYLRLDVERQEMQADGKWSEWAPIDRKIFEEFNKFSKTTEEEEWVPAESRIDKLVDPLPHFEVGYWVGAHHGDLVPRELIAPKPPASAKGNRGRGPGGERDGPMGGPMGGAMGGGAMGGPTSGGALGGPNMGDGPPGGGRLGGGSPGAAGGAGEFQKTSADWIMIRALDMNVKPDASYRYRVRIYFANPNYNVDEALLTPGTDNHAKEQHGPWSETTAPVNFPGDVATYALQKAFAGPGMEGREAVQFQVVKWNPKDGYLFVRNYDQAPGQIIGETAMMSVPSNQPDKPGPVMQNVDLTSHQILADALGGDRPMSELQGLTMMPFKSPALAIVMRADGTLVLRDQARDAANGEMADQKAIFDRFTKDMQQGSKKKGRNSSLGIGGGMDGAYGGPGGGNYGGPGGGAGPGRPGGPGGRGVN